jgi:hypothetical protein
MNTHLESSSVTHTVSDQAGLGDIIELGLAPGGTWQQNDLTAITGAPQIASAPFAYVAPDGSGRVVYKDGDGDVIELWLPAGTETWQHDSLTAITGAPQASSAPIALVTPGNVARVIYQDSNDSITELWLAPGAETWQSDSPTAIAGAPALGGAPVACVTPDQVTRVFYNTGSSIIELSLALGGTWQQTNLTDITGVIVADDSAPFAYVTPDGTARVLYSTAIFAVGLNGQNAQDIIELRLAPGGTTWQSSGLIEDVSDPPAPQPSGNPFAYVGPDGLARVLYKEDSDGNGNGDIIELRLDQPGGWVYSDLTISVSKPPAPPAASALFAYVGSDALARVLYTGSNGDIIELRLDPDGWVYSDLTISVNDPPAPPAASAPFAYVTPDKVDRVYYSSLPS